MRDWFYKLIYSFVSCLRSGTSPGFILFWLHLLDSCYQSLQFSETFSSYSYTLNFLFKNFSALKAAQDFLAICRDMFLILSLPQATKATPSFSFLPTILMGLIHPLPLFSHIAFAVYHSMIDCPHPCPVIALTSHQRSASVKLDGILSSEICQFSLLHWTIFL